MKKLLNVLTIISGSFVCLTFGINLISALIQRNGIGIILIIVTGLTAALIQLIFIKKMKIPIKVLFCIGMCFYMVSYTVLFVYIMSYPDSAVAVSESAEENEYIIMVYGCRTYLNRPGKALKLRLDKAYELLMEYPDSLCIVSGGKGNNEPITEAESMKNYLSAAGIDENRIYLEPDSHSTVENVKMTKELIEKENLSRYKVVGVSAEYHLRRINIICDKYEFETFLVPAKSENIFALISDITREYLSYIKLLFTL